MARCPNCGQKTSGGYCQWCKYPIFRSRPARRRKAEKQAKKEAELAAREKAKREAEEAQKAREAEKQAKKEAELAAREKSKREAEEAQKAREAEKQAKKEAELVTLPPIDFDQVKQVEECLRQVESICEELRTGQVDTKEALQRLSDISERIAK